jgi:hypothetical protein
MADRHTRRQIRIRWDFISACRPVELTRRELALM